MRWQRPDGAIDELEGKTGYGRPKYAVGSSVPVLVDPDDPADVRLDPGGAVVVARVLRWVAAGCALVAVVLLALILVGLPPDGWLPG